MIHPRLFRSTAVIAILLFALNVAPSQSSWTPTETIITGLASGLYDGKITLTADSALHLVVKNRFYDYPPVHITSRNGIWSGWTDVWDSTARFFSLAPDSAGGLHAVWTGGVEMRELYLSHFVTDSGWTARRLIQSGSIPSLFPHLYSDPRDTLHLLWILGNNDVMTLLAGNPWYAKIVRDSLVSRSMIGDANMGAGTMWLGMDSLDVLRALWENPDPRNYHLNQFQKTKTFVWWSTDWIGEGQLSRFRADRNRDIHLVYSEVGTINLNYRRFIGGRWSQPEPVAGRGSNDLENQLVIDLSNRPIVFWADPDSGMEFFVRGRRSWSLPHPAPDGGWFIGAEVDRDNRLHAFWGGGGNVYHSSLAIDTIPPVIGSGPVVPETVTRGDSLVIAWSLPDTADVGTTFVDFSGDGGETWTTIDTVSGADTSIAWRAPWMELGQCLFRLTCLDSWMNESAAISDTFSVINIPPSRPVLLEPAPDFTTGIPRVTMRWRRAVDSPGDTVRYALSVRAALRETTMTALSDTLVSFDGTGWFEDGGSYQWSVEATDAAATVVSDPVAATFTVDYVPPAGFALLSPVGGTVISGNHLNLRWGRAHDSPGDTVRYGVRVFGPGADSSRTSIVETTAHFIVRNWLTPRETYEWSVSASDGIFTIGNEGGTGSFVVANIPPSRPVMLLPPDSATIGSASVHFRWSKSLDDPGETVTYQLRISEGSGGDVDTVLPAGPDTSLTFDGSTWLSPDLRYSWTVVASDGLETVTTSEPDRSFTGAGAAFTDEFQLQPNFPNPFNSGTEIRLIVGSPGRARIAVYDVFGREVAVLLDGEVRRGTHAVIWNAVGVASGVYYCKGEFQGRPAVTRMMVMK